MCEKCDASNESVPIGAPRTTAVADAGTALSGAGRWPVKMDSSEGGTTKAHFVRLTSRPTHPAMLQMVRRASFRALTDCANIRPSSRYHIEWVPWITATAFVTADSPAAKRRGPMGSPCCTPLAEDRAWVWNSTSGPMAADLDRTPLRRSRSVCGQGS